MTTLWETAAAQFEAPTRRWATPGDLAARLNPKTVRTRALDLVDEALVKLADEPDGRLIITMAPQEGKLVADETLVATPTGWAKHGDLRVGDHVFHPSGRPVLVAHVHEPAHATMRVHFSDHGHVDVHPNHEWTVHDRTSGNVRTVETKYLASTRLSYGPEGQRGHRYRFSLPHREALDLPDVDLPLDPYTLGVWLGDGSTTKAAVTHHPDDRYDLPYPESARCVHPGTGIITTYYRGGLLAALRAAGVLGAKHIPAAYLRASVEQRRALLAGLIDTDGHVSASGQVSFDNANAALVRSTAELLRTLGYRAHVHQPTPAKLSSSGIQGVQDMWRVTYTPHDVSTARLPRKADGKTGIRRRVAITRVETIDPRPGRCITVDSPDGLYLVGEHLTPTHNSVRVAKDFPLWWLTQRPDTRIVVASYGQMLANRNGKAIRRDITDHPDLGLRLAPDNGAAHDWTIDGHTGGVFSVGIGGGLTGRPADLLIIDDPIKDQKEADSETFRENVWEWWTGVAAARLAPGAPAVVILTRWHHDDLAGRLLAEDGSEWRVLNIPAQADHDPAKGETDILDRQPGEFMDSTRRRTRPQWERRKREAGTRKWTSQYQGRPSPATGDIFDSSWWRTYNQAQWVERPDGSRFIIGADRGDVEVAMSYDLAFKDTDGSDYVVGQVWLRRGPDAYLIDQVRGRMSFVETCHAIRRMSAKWPQAVAKLVEDKANGPAVLNALRRTVPGLIPVEPEGSKTARASAVTPLIEAGNVWLPSPELAPWVGDLIAEANDFPAGKHDDQVDALTQALHRLLLVPIMDGTLVTSDDVLDTDDDDDPFAYAMT